MRTTLHVLANVVPMPASVSVFFLGGTIGMAGAAGAVVRFGPGELIESVPGLAGLDCKLDPHDFRRLPSASLGFVDVLELLATASGTAADGVVVVQGTDTLEETAFLADLLWSGDTPIVFTGAMRNPSQAGPDGPANLLGAVTVAASPACRGLGALVVLNDEIHAARHAAKRHTSSVAAFSSPNAGPLGRIVEGVAVLTMPVSRRPTLPMPDAVDVRVPVVTSVFDDDGALLDGLAERCDGVVVAGFGVGHVPERVASQLGAIAAVRPVVLASRIGAGPVLRRTYGAIGSETDLLARGLIGAGMLNPYQARLLLMLLLASGADVTAGFATYG